MIEPFLLAGGCDNCPPVSAVLHLAQGPQRCGALLVPGAGGDLNDRGLVALADVLSAHGVTTIRANLFHREQGRRFPPPIEVGAAQVGVIFRRVKARFGDSIDTRRWLLGGKSYGGRAASVAVAAGLNVDALVLYSYPLHPPAQPEKLRVGHFAEIATPTLFVHGTRDPFGDVRQLRNEYRAISGAVTLEVVEGGDHSLHVRRVDSPDGKVRHPEHAFRELSPRVGAWLDAVVPCATAT